MKNLSLIIKYGVYTSIALIAYFLMLSLFNLHINPTFSFFNAFITAFGIYELVRVYKLKASDTFTYGEGISAGVITGSIATILFTIFFLIYSTEISTGFLSALLNTLPGTFDINAGLITFIIATMGFATTLVSSLTVMQLFKTSRNIVQSS